MKLDEKEKFEFKVEALKNAREAKGYKQDELAKMIFTTRQSISNWENGKRVPTLENVNRLSEILEISMDDLIIRKVDGDLNNETLETNNDNSFSMLYIPTVDKKTTKDLKFIKRILILILILLTIYIGCSIRKFLILTDIRNKMIKYEDVDNYSYFKTYCKIENMEYTDYYTEKRLYKDGISKAEYYNGEFINTIYIKNNKPILIHEDSNVYEILETYNKEKIEEIKKVEDIFPKLVSRKNFINFINSFNPYFSIKKNRDQCIIDTNINKLHTIENIGIDGLLKEKNIFYSDDKYEKVTYEIKFDCVMDEDLKVNYEDYNLKK